MRDPMGERGRTMDKNGFFERYPHLKPKPWPIWKRFLHAIWSSFEWGDHEYLRGTLGKFPYTVWLTIYEPRWRTGWRKLMPYRIRFAWAGLLRDWVCQSCTLCNQKITLRELLDRTGVLQRHMSGSACHATCSRLYAEAMKAARGGAN